MPARPAVHAHPAPGRHRDGVLRGHLPPRRQRSAPYNAWARPRSKSLAFTLAKEERRHGIHVNVVAPGLVDYGHGEAAGPGHDRGDGHPCPRRDVALRPRLPADRCRPGSCSGWLCSEDAGYVTGQRIRVRRRRHAALLLSPRHGCVADDDTCVSSPRHGRPVEAGRSGGGRVLVSGMPRQEPAVEDVSVALDGERRRVGREAAPQDRRSRSDAEPRTVTSAVTPPSLRLTLNTRRSVQSVHGSAGPSVATSRTEPPIIDPVAAAEDHRAPDLEQLVDPSAASAGSIGSGSPTARCASQRWTAVSCACRRARTAGRRGRRRSSRPAASSSTAASVRQGPTPASRPVGDRPGLRGGRSSAVRSGCAPVTTATVAQRWTLPTWPNQPCDVPARAGRHVGIEGTSGAHRRRAPRPPCGPRPRSRWAGRNRGQARSECTGRRYPVVMRRPTPPRRQSRF